MKRCPKCEFLYEDDQNLCDMDGITLVFDARKLPKLNALEAIPTGTSSRSWKTRTMPAIAGLVLTTVLAFVYYVSTRHNSNIISPANVSSTPGSQPASLIQPPVTPNSTTATNPEAPVTKPAAESKPVEAEKEKTADSKKAEPSEKANQVTEQKKAKAKRPTPTPATQKVSTNKKDSKVESFLKKTGKLLKKPFKF